MPVKSSFGEIKNINWELIKSLREYDIVFVRMNDGDIKGEIGEGHEQRPFLINKISDNFLYGYYLTGNLKYRCFRKDRHENLRLILDKVKYGFQKDSLVLYNREITLPYENVLFYMEHLDDYDINVLKKYRDILLGKGLISTKDNVLIRMGDVIRYNSKYYIIYQIYDGKCFGYCISKINGVLVFEEDYNYIKYNKNTYLVDYDDCITVNIDDELHVLEKFGYDIARLIVNNKKHKIKEEKGKRKRNGMKKQLTK